MENDVLRIMWWGSQQRHQVTLEAIQFYQKLHPDIQFETEYSGINGYLDKLTTEVVAGRAPDIYQIDPSWVADLAAQHRLADLSEGIDLQDVDKKLLGAGKYEGKLYAIPLGSTAHGMIYDKAGMEKLGLALPKNGWTWEDFFQMAKDSVRKLNKEQYFTLDYAGNYFAYSAYQYAAGKGELLADDGTFHIDKDTFLDWGRRFEELRGIGAVPPAELNASDRELDLNGDLMVGGQILIRLSFSNNFVSWDSMKPGAFDLVTMPRSAQAGGWLKPSMLFGVDANSAHTNEAKAFIDWFTNSPDAVRILGTTRGNPVNTRVSREAFFDFSDEDRVGIQLYNATVPDGQQWTPGPSGTAEWVEKDWDLVEDKLSFGKETPEQAFEELRLKAQRYETK
ncbi:ABC transporter substrate-binding protein [Cohnella fermenti]|nr:extracellular solute-binding protein [Cohnella fermenti]